MGQKVYKIKYQLRSADVFWPIRYGSMFSTMTQQEEQKQKWSLSTMERAPNAVDNEKMRSDNSFLGDDKNIFPRAFLYGWCYTWEWCVSSDKQTPIIHRNFILLMTSNRRERKLCRLYWVSGWGNHKIHQAAFILDLQDNILVISAKIQRHVLVRIQKMRDI